MLVLLKSSLVILVTLVVVHLLRRQSAATRHMVLTTGLICALVVPLLSSVLPEWRATRIVNYSYEVPMLGVVSAIDDSPLTRSYAPLPTRTPLSLAAVAFWIWLAGVFVAAAVLVAGVVRIEMLMRGAEPVTLPLHIPRRVRVVENQRAVLGTWGVLRPQLLLPSDIHQWSEERLRIVLTHEIAHIKRMDWLVQMVAEGARCIYWFNPLFWLLCRRLRLESELACDDVVLDLGTDGRNYAAHLLDIARAMKNSERVSSPILAMAQSPHLERRFVAMLNPSLNHGRITRKCVLVAFVVAISLTLPLAAMRAPEQTAAHVPTPSVVSTTVTVAAPKSPTPSAKKSPALKSAPVQAEFGGLFGTVYDPSGAVVPAVVITATNVDTKQSQQTTAGDAGDFEFPRLGAGEYTFEALLPGFVAFRNRVIIKSNERLKQNVTLLLGNIVERIIVRGTGQPKPATLLPPGTPRRIRVGGNVQAANLISQVRPVYPPSAQDTGVEGTVALEGIISTDGTFQSLRVLSSIDRDLTAAALEAVKQWRYRPTLLNGEPVEVLTTINVDFKLTQ